MSLTVDTSQYFSNAYANGISSSSDKTGSAQALENTLTGLSDTADDKELMDACKSFEAYFVEKVFKEMEKTVKPDGEDNKYLEYFGDMMVQEMADSVVDTQSLGIAQTLYESMKRNQG